jgi:threonine dehydratase
VIPLDAIESARERIAGAAVRTPLVRLHADDRPPPGGGPTEIWLKLENLQPIASFKIRGAANAVRSAPPAEREAGLVTASAGNMAQGVAWMARELGVPATIVVPEHAPQTKLGAIERLGGRVMRVPFADWWRAIEESRVPDVDGLFVHPVEDERVMAGNGTIALEILEDLPEPDVVLVPYGGGGLVTGIASGLKALRPGTHVYAVEPETGAALNAALAAGEPTEVDYSPSFVDGSGSRSVLPGMWPRVRDLIDGAFTASLAETAAAVRLLAERTRIVAEGAGALAPAAALAGHAGPGSVVCVVSGGNIDLTTLGTILAGETP